MVRAMLQRLLPICPRQRMHKGFNGCAAMQWCRVRHAAAAGMRLASSCAAGADHKALSVERAPSLLLSQRSMITGEPGSAEFITPSEQWPTRRIAQSARLRPEGMGSPRSQGGSVVTQHACRTRMKSISNAFLALHAWRQRTLTRHCRTASAGAVDDVLCRTLPPRQRQYAYAVL